MWTHKNGTRYRVIVIANDNADRQFDYPTTIVYINTANFTIWCRPLSKWHSSFTPYIDAELMPIKKTTAIISSLFITNANL